MSTPPPPEEPTRPLPPTEPPPPRVREREVYADEEGGYRLEELRDQLRSLKTAAALLGVLAVTALGVALWALISGNDDQRTQPQSQTRRGASPARVSDLEGRVRDLESRAKDAPAKSELAALKSEQKSAADRLAKLESAGSGQPDAASKQAVDSIQQDLQDLSKRVDQVEQQQQQQPNATP